MGGETVILKVAAFVYARMSSKRLPGKVLLPLDGKPLIMHSINTFQTLSIEPFILTSDDVSDDPIEILASKSRISQIRGSLNNVAHRTKDAILASEADYFFRVNADSPFVNGAMIQWGLSQVNSELSPHVITNVLGKTFPYGLSLELVQSDIFLSSIDSFTPVEREHITSHFYNHHFDYKVTTFDLSASYQTLKLVVDTQKDYENINDNYDKFSRLRDCPLNDLEKEIKYILNK